jgi:hypothetical protein
VLAVQLRLPKGAPINDDLPEEIDAMAKFYRTQQLSNFVDHKTRLLTLENNYIEYNPSRDILSVRKEKLSGGGATSGAIGRKYETKRHKMPSIQDQESWVESTDESSEKESWSGRDEYD